MSALATTATGAVDLSILTPSYQYAQFIEDSLASVAEQQGITIEHIVQDACSTDGTLDVLRRWDGRVRWRSEPDEGQSDALNRALGLARGRWVAWLNADEFYLPGGLERLVRAGDRDDADVVYGDTVFVDAEGALERLVPQHAFSGFILRSYGPFIGTESVIFRRETLGEQPIDVSFRRMMDWELFLRMLRDGRRFRYVPVPVGAFRAHDVRVTASERRGFFERLNRDDGFGREYDLLGERYGALRVRRVGHALHGLRKLSSGSYLRQYRARNMRGVGLRWFADQDGRRGCEQLLRACYGATPA